MAKGPKPARAEMELILEKLAAIEKRFDKLDELQQNQQELKAEMATNQKELKVVQQLSAENKKKVDGLEGDVQAIQRKEETRGFATLALQMDKMSYFLRFQNVEETDQEDLKDVMINLLGDFLGRGLDFMSWDVDQAYRVNSQFARTHGVPREVHVKFVKRETREEILRKQRTGALKYRGREITILRQIPRQVRELRRKYYFLSTKLYQKGIGFRWLMPEGMMILQEGMRKKISSVAEATAYMDEHKALLESEDAGTEEGEVREDQGAGAGAPVVSRGEVQAETMVLRSKIKK